MRVLHDLCNILEDELEDIVKAGEMNRQDLELADKAVDIIKDIKTINAMEDASYDSGYTNRAYYDDGMNMARGSRGGRSGRDVRGGYTRHDEKEMLEDKIDELKRQLDQMR